MRSGRTPQSQMCGAHGIHGRTGEVTDWQEVPRRREDEPAGNGITFWLRVLHFGQMLGRAYQVFVSLAGLVIAVLAATITLTPGTVAVDLTQDRRQLLIHGLDIENEAALIAVLKNRYEALLKEIFAEC